MSSRSSQLRRISNELATEIEKRQKKYQEIGVNKSYTECSKDVAAELRILKSKGSDKREGLW